MVDCQKLAEYAVEGEGADVEEAARREGGAGPATEAKADWCLDSQRQWAACLLEMRRRQCSDEVAAVGEVLALLPAVDTVEERVLVVAEEVPSARMPGVQECRVALQVTVPKVDC